jgi:hypothetical protein
VLWRLRASLSWSSAKQQLQRGTRLLRGSHSALASSRWDRASSRRCRSSRQPRPPFAHGKWSACFSWRVLFGQLKTRSFDPAIWGNHDSLRRRLGRAANGHLIGFAYRNEPPTQGGLTFGQPRSTARRPPLGSAQLTTLPSNLMRAAWMSGSLWKVSSMTAATGVGSGTLTSAAGFSDFHGGASGGAGGSLYSGAASTRESRLESPPLGRGVATTGAGCGTGSGCGAMAPPFFPRLRSGHRLFH